MMTLRAYHRRVCAGSLGFVVSLMAGSALAADPPPPLPTPVAPAPPPPPPTAGGRPPNTVRANITTFRNKGTARLYVARGDGAYSQVCQAPCKADVVPGTPLRVTYGSDTEEGHDFTMAGNPGEDVDIEVRPASKGALAGGIVMVSIGGATALIGLLVVAVAQSTRINDRDDLRTAGWVTTAIGVGLTVVGIVVLMNRSKEPRITENNHAPSRSENKTDLFRSDVASLRPADPWTTAAPVVMPFSYGLSF